MYPFYTEICKSFCVVNSKNMVETKRPITVLQYTNINVIYFRFLGTRFWKLHTLSNIFITKECGLMDIL